MRRTIFAAFALYLASAALAVAADVYPSKQIRLVDPWPPGSGADLIARTLSQKLGEVLGQSMYVDNRGGASGTIGSASVAREAASDGYTLILGNSSSHGSAKVIYPNLPYDPAEDFTPISLLYRNPLVVMVNKDFPVGTIQELIAYARANPAKVSYGSPGLGTPHMLAAEVLKSRAGVDIAHIPYKGGGPVMNDLLGGHIQMAVSAVSIAVPVHRTGKAKVLAVTTQERNPALPEMPALSELYPGFDIAGWNALFGPKNLPGPIVARLNAAVRQVLGTAEVKAIFENAGYTPRPSSPDELRQRVKAEVARWEEISRSGIKVR
jgi:tripartite-type tricarboxylate transporter receptor subunit TctC